MYWNWKKNECTRVPWSEQSPSTLSPHARTVILLSKSLFHHLWSMILTWTHQSTDFMRRLKKSSISHQKCWGVFVFCPPCHQRSLSSAQIIPQRLFFWPHLVINSRHNVQNKMTNELFATLYHWRWSFHSRFIRNVWFLIEV